MMALLDTGDGVRVSEPGTEPWDGVIVRFCDSGFCLPGEAEAEVMHKSDYDTNGQSHDGNTKRVEIQFLMLLDPGKRYREQAIPVLRWLADLYIIQEQHIESLAGDYAKDQLEQEDTSHATTDAADGNASA